MERKSECMRSLLKQRSGITMGSRLYPSVGSLSEIPKRSSRPRPCFVPTLPLLQIRSSSGLCVAGRSKSPFMKYGRIWVWKPNDSGQICPSCGSHLPYLLCFPSSPCWPTAMPENSSYLSNKRPGTPRNYQRFPMHWLWRRRLFCYNSIFQHHHFVLISENHTDFDLFTTILALFTLFLVFHLDKV